MCASVSLTWHSDAKRRYCPQFDAIQANMTGREHLEFYATIRGIPAPRIGPLVEELLSKTGLLKCVTTVVHIEGSKTKYVHWCSAVVDIPRPLPSGKEIDGILFDSKRMAGRHV